MYDADWFHPVKKVCAKDIWEYDKNRKDALKKEFGFVIFEVWEKSITKDGKEAIIIEEIDILVLFTIKLKLQILTLIHP